MSGAKDELLGLKENIIIGHLILAGTGMSRYRDVEFEGLEIPEVQELPPLAITPPNVFSLTDDDDFSSECPCSRPG